jgi:hypothetical protein
MGNSVLVYFRDLDTKGVKLCPVCKAFFFPPTFFKYLLPKNNLRIILWVFHNQTRNAFSPFSNGMPIKDHEHAIDLGATVKQKTHRRIPNLNLYYRLIRHALRASAQFFWVLWVRSKTATRSYALTKPCACIRKNFSEFTSFVSLAKTPSHISKISRPKLPGNPQRSQVNPNLEWRQSE